MSNGILLGFVSASRLSPKESSEGRISKVENKKDGRKGRRRGPFDKNGKEKYQDLDS